MPTTRLLDDTPKKEISNGIDRAYVSSSYPFAGVAIAVARGSSIGGMYCVETLDTVLTVDTGVTVVVPAVSMVLTVVAVTTPVDSLVATPMVTVEVTRVFEAK